MIREYRFEDEEMIISLISSVDTGYEIDGIKDIQSIAKKFIVYGEGEIKGFAYTTLFVDEAQDKRANIILYVEPQSRRQGIGTALFDELMIYLTEMKPTVLTAYMRVDIDNPGSFCTKLGFKKWWGSPELFYKGSSYPNVDIVFVQYEDEYYEQYATIKSDCYYEIQITNDIRPFRRPLNEKDRQKYLINKNNMYLLLDGDQIIASVTIGSGTIDNIMVSPSYQGKGYGKKALQFAMNKMLSQGYDEIRLCYMEGNTSAESLYYSLGFEFLQNTHVYRKFL